MRRLLTLSIASSLVTFIVPFSACQPRVTGPAVQPAWKVIGPGGGGAQYLSTINPRDPNHVFVRCDMTGAYVTENDGGSWRMFNLRTVVQDFEFDPTSPNTVYASNSGLYRSEDRGRTWRLVYPAPEDIAEERMVGDHADHSFLTRDGQVSSRISKVRVDPGDGNRLYIGMAAPYTVTAESGPRPAGNEVSVLFSSDRGRSWREAVRIAGHTVLAIFPGIWDDNPGRITVFSDLAAVTVSLADGSKVDISLPVEKIDEADGGRGPEGMVFYLLSQMAESPGGVAGGVYRSTDGARSWTQVNGGLLADFKSSHRLPRFRTIAVCEGDPRVAFLSCTDYFVKAGDNLERRFGIFKTADSGEKWSWSYCAGSDSILAGKYDGGWMMKNYGPEWGEYPMSIGVSPTNANVVWANDFGCTYRSLDGGATWQQVYSRELPDGSVTTRGLDVTTCYGVHFDPFDPRHLYISYTDIGAFHSFNGGESWFQSITGVPQEWHNTCYWMVFDPEVKGKAWSVWGSGHDLPRPKMFRGGNFDRFVGGVAVSADAARTWTKSNTGMPDNTVSTHILLDPDSPRDSRTLYVCGFGKGVFKSTDGGANWQLANNGIGPNLNAWRITRTPDGKLFLLVARGLEGREVVDGALYLSTDGAATWQPVALPEGVNAPNDLVYDPTQPEVMYLSLWPSTVDGREKFGGLLRTEDGGMSWRRVFREDAHVYAAAVDPDNPNTVIINTFDSAAFRSDDRGETWHRLKGYTFKWGHRPVFDPHNQGMLYLTTFGGSVFYGPAGGVPDSAEEIIEPTWQKWYGM
ncbi:MAG: hypothetical protein V1794_00940 [Candidatus Glassbacteria bacterium]